MKNYIYFLFALLLYTSCEDEVDIDIPQTDALLVVDAWLNDKSDIQEILLSQSQGYFDSSAPNTISGAEVIVSNVSTNTEFTFSETSPGIYQYDLLGSSLGSVEDVFNLEIIINGNSYTSSTIYNGVPAIDSLPINFEDEDLRPDGYYAEVFARDLPGLGDSYWIKSYVNGQFLNKPAEINIAFDAGFDDGGMVDGLIFIPPIRTLVNPVLDSLEFEEPPLQPGDEITVEVHSMSNAAFFFMERARDQLQNGDNGIFAQPIANTLGNIVSEDTDEVVLGVFNVAAVSSATNTVPQ